MDVVVTIPKSEYANDDLETEDMKKRDLIQFWALPRRPKNLNVGDRIYFVKYGKVESSMRVLEIEVQGRAFEYIRCETTGRDWSKQCQVYMDDLREEDGPEIRGFQGFRYRWWETEGGDVKNEVPENG